MILRTQDEQKKAAALCAAGELRDGMILGLGTGSTVYHLICQTARLVSEGMNVRAVPTSEATKHLAGELGIPMLPPEAAPCIDLAIDGVDALDSRFCAVKGGGGALFQEKVIAKKARRVIWILDESKLAEHLSQVPLPVEAVLFGICYLMEEIREMGFKPELRHTDGQIFHTDNKNYILDLMGNSDMNYREMAKRLKALTGVVETGFFPELCEKIIIGGKNGITVRENN